MKTLPEIANPLPFETRERVNEVLNGVLAELTDLHSQCKHAHWNVQGQLFFMLHKLFDKLAKGIAKHIDPVAERITALGGLLRGRSEWRQRARPCPSFPNLKVEEILVS